MKPTIGRIVHFYDEMLKDFGPRGAGPFAAVVTFVHSDTVINLEVFPSRTYGDELTSIELRAGDRGQTRWWEWPEAYARAKMQEAMADLQKAQADPNADVPSNENVV